MGLVWYYNDKAVIQFNDKTRASFSRKRYGTLFDKVVNLSLKEDRKIWNYYDQKTNKEIIFLVDKDNQYLVYEKYWQLNCKRYAFSRANNTKEYSHHRVIGSNELTDHIDRVKTNNLRSNLRIVSPSINDLNRSIASNNTSGVTGVSWSKSEQKWRARMQFEGKEKSKYFDSFEQAVECRKTWEQEIYSNLG